MQNVPMQAPQGEPISRLDGQCLTPLDQALRQFVMVAGGG
jgi:hypothetical protein